MIRGAAAAWLALGAASAALAQPSASSDCVWQATTAPMRDAMRASLHAHGGIVDALTVDQANSLMRACRLTDTGTSTSLMIETLRGRTLVQEAEEGLKASRGLAPERLAEGWRRLTPSDRRSLGRAFDSSFNLSEPVSDALNAWALSLELSPGADRALLFDYAVGRALLDRVDVR
jgi:hypothetical protein